MNLDRIKQIASENLAHRSSHPWKERGNKYTHGIRVGKLALRLREIVFPEKAEYDDILVAAAAFHDIANGNDDHAVIGAAQTRELLQTECTAAELDRICSIIAIHDDRACDRESIPEITKLHQDADHIDHFGCFDIWQTIIYAVHHHQSVDEIINGMTIERMQQEIIWRNELNFEVSKSIYDEKMRYFNEFKERFAVEFNGGIWNENNLLNM